MWMRLPLALTLQYDYFVWKNLFVNATCFTGIYLRNNDGKKVHELTRISITPRWEKRWYGVWMPLSYSRLGNLCIGTGFRIGPLIVGTTNVLPLIFKNKTTYTADLYFALKVPLFPIGKAKKKKKTNADGKVDECPD